MLFFSLTLSNLCEFRAGERCAANSPGGVVYGTQGTSRHPRQRPYPAALTPGRSWPRRCVRQRAGRAATDPAGGRGSCPGTPLRWNGNERRRAVTSTFFLSLHVVRDVCSAQPPPAPLQPLHASKHPARVCHTYRQNCPPLAPTGNSLEKGQNPPCLRPHDDNVPLTSARPARHHTEQGTGALQRGCPCPTSCTAPAGPILQGLTKPLTPCNAAGGGDAPIACKRSQNSLRNSEVCKEVSEDAYNGRIK